MQIGLVIYNPKIKMINKFKIFDTAAKTIMFYGAQVWDIESYETDFLERKYFFYPIILLTTCCNVILLILSTVQ